MTNSWSVLKDPIFRRFWLAGAVSGIGGVVQDVTAGWLMTSLTPSPIYTALLQTAGSLPVFVLALPAGALADILDRRRWMLALVSALLVLALGLGVLAAAGALSPALLLLTVSLAGAGTALYTPASMRTVPDLLSGHSIPLGVTLNSSAVNLARLVGGVVAGVLLAHAPVGSGFFANAVSFVPMLLVLVWWPGKQRESALPPERLPGAMAAGWRYIRNSPPLRRVFLRVILFIVSASALPTLLPLVARRELELGPLGFGLFLGAFGAGALLGASGLGFLQERLHANQIISLATLTIAAASLSLAMTRQLAVLFPTLILAGAAWVMAVSTFGVSTGSSAPHWVLARALSFFMLSFQGGMALGAAAWGACAAGGSTSRALMIAAVSGVLGWILSLRFPLPDSDPHQLAPAQPWPAPPHVAPDASDRGSVLIMIAYEIDPARADGFRTAMAALRAERLRDGAYAWRLFTHPSDPRRYQEHFLISSWLEHLRQHERVTEADRATWQAVRAFHTGVTEPGVVHLVEE
ncbi:MAG: MFS transporter [Bryobacteraceae bacterium]|nr:MFS transporter [Bryobacteraceae bacterium]